MKAYISGGHYHLHIDWDEYNSLPENPLKAQLKDQSDGSDIGKKVMLELDRGMTEDKVNLVPHDSNWSELKEIDVTMTNYGHKKLGQTRLYVIRFVSQSIDIHLEDDISGLI